MSSMTQLLTFFLAYGGGSSSTPKDASRFLQEPGSCRCFTAFRQVARACYQLQGRRWRQSSGRFLDVGLEMGCKGLTEFAWGEHFLGVQSSRPKTPEERVLAVGGDQNQASGGSWREDWQVGAVAAEGTVASPSSLSCLLSLLLLRPPFLPPPALSLFFHRPVLADSVL